MEHYICTDYGLCKKHIEPKHEKHPEPKPGEKSDNSSRVKKDDCCCCSGSYRRALSLLNNPEISQFIDFNSLGLLGKKYAVGGDIAPSIDAARKDNFPLSSFSISLQCIECNLVKIAPVAPATVVALNPITPGIDTNYQLNINSWSLCDLDVVRLVVDDELFTTTPTDNITSWNTFKAFFKTLLYENHPQYVCNKNCNDCCCSEDIIKQLNSCVFFGNQGNIVNLTSWAWVWSGLEVLGIVGCILILTTNNNTGASDPSLFFVCLNSVGGIYKS